MRVYLRPIFEYKNLPRNLQEDLMENDQRYTLKKEEEGSSLILSLKELRDERGKFFVLPKSLSSSPRPAEWKINITTVGEDAEDALVVAQDQQPLPPYYKGVNGNGGKVCKWTAPSGSLTILFVRERGDGAQVVSMQPVVRMRPQAHEGLAAYYVDPRMRILGPPDPLRSFLRKGARPSWIQRFLSLRRR